MTLGNIGNAWMYKNQYKDMFCVVENTKNPYLKSEFNWCSTIEECYEVISKLIRDNPSLTVDSMDREGDEPYKEGFLMVEVYRAGKFITGIKRDYSCYLKDKRYNYYNE